MKLRWFGLLAMSSVLVGTASAAQRIDLGGSGWTFHTTLDEKALPVSVPHTWMTMHGYERFIGNATYQHDFIAPNVKPGEVVRLHFDAVYDVAHVWFNGRMVGVHEGGYTPFEFDVTKLMKPGMNHILVEVDNTPTLSTIPAIASSHGSKDYPLYGTAAGEGIVGWMPYGGIVRPVSLLITDAVYLQKMKVDAKPDLDQTYRIDSGASMASQRQRCHQIGFREGGCRGTTDGVQACSRCSEWRCRGGVAGHTARRASVECARSVSI